MSIEQVGPKDYMPALDGLRGFACLLVAVSHICVIFNLNFIHLTHILGAAGVTLFFALSGFLMSSLYIRKDYNLDSAGKYIIARLSRIAPAYYIALIVSIILSFFITDFKYQMDLPMTIRSFVFMGSNNVFWSIPPEVQFYGYFLLIWLAYNRYRQGKYAMLTVLSVVTVALIVSRDMWSGIMLPSKLHIFMGGVLAAIAMHQPKIKAISKNMVFQVGIIVVTFWYIATFVNLENIYPDMVLPALIAIIVMSLSNSTMVTKILELNFMRVMGAASFSIYLFHDMLLWTFKSFGIFEGNHVLVNIFIASFIVVSIPVAFHYLAERHLNKTAKDRGNEVFDYAKIKWPLKLIRR